MKPLQSEHYRIQTDLAGPLAQDLAKRLDAMFDEYSRRLSSFADGRDVPVMDAILFRHREDYLSFTHAKNSGGMYYPKYHVLCAFLEGQGRDELRATLKHEAFHQFAHTIIAEDLPVWLDEGMAQVFEEGIFVDDHFWLGQIPPHRVMQLESDMNSGRLIDFKRFLSMSNAEWNANMQRDANVSTLQYNQAWAMVHFLVHAQDDRGKQHYRPLLLQMMKFVHEGKDGVEAFKMAFSPNVDGFRERFTEYATRMKASPEATLVENESVLADFAIYMKTKERRKIETIAGLRGVAKSHEYFKTHGTGEYVWKSDPNLGRYFCDVNGTPLDENELYLEANEKAPLPDIVCKTDKLVFRTRFFTEGDQISHELVVESRGR